MGPGVPWSPDFGDMSEESEESDPDAEWSSEQLSGEVKESEEEAVTPDMIIGWSHCQIPGEPSPGQTDSRCAGVSAVPKHPAYNVRDVFATSFMISSDGSVCSQPRQLESED